MRSKPQFCTLHFALCTFLALGGSVGVAQQKSGLRTEDLFEPQEARKRGVELVSDLLSRPPEASTKTNLLRIRGPGGSQAQVQVPVRFDIRETADGWVSTFETLSSPATAVANPGGPATEGGKVRLVVKGGPGKPNSYELTRPGSDPNDAPRKLSGNETMVPFAGSEFWVADLGLEFLHWPAQSVLKKEIRKGQACDVLESVNPKPATTGYAKVRSWIDTDTGGIVHADAYDASGKILKQFDPSELQKVNGRMQVREIEMRNRKTGARSWVVFDLR